MEMNKRGWVRIVEAFVAVMMISGVVLIIIDQGNSQNGVSDLIHDTEIGILRDVQLDNSLRAEVLGTSGKVLWENFPSQTKSLIESKIPNTLECNAQICDASDNCVLDDPVQKDIFSESVLISANLNTFNPRVLKLFCWEK